MILDFSTKAIERSNQPHYDVGLLSFHEINQIVELLGRNTLIANGTGIDMVRDSADVSRDRLIEDRQKIEYFRYMALTIIERLAHDDPTAWQAPDPTSRRESDFLRPVFNQVLKRGTTMWTVLREMQQAVLPIPEDYFVFLPSPDSGGFRDDVIRSLVPFEKAQRQALQAGWNDETVAIRITHKDAKPSALILN